MERLPADRFEDLGMIVDMLVTCAREIGYTEQAALPAIASILSDIIAGRLLGTKVPLDDAQQACDDRQ